MCGIAGFVDFDGRSDRPELEKMTDSLRHRGPDASGYYVDRTDGYAIGLGHRRLSIIDLSPAGNQPMQFQNGRYWIVFNGEIYNYAELKEQLAAKGRHFQSHSDTEVILHAYHEWGPESLSRFVGMFAFVIYDTQERKLFCCRDRAGVKPFFYFWDGKHFLFGSELKAILVNPYAEKRIDNRAIASFLQFGYIPSNQCIFQQTYKLLPGHFLLFDLNRISIHTEQYWSVYSYYNREKLKISLEDAIPETERILSKAFRYRMVADVPVGVFLSGGYDSSCLAALLQKDSAQKLKTFTIGFDDQKLNEAEYAKEIAARLGTDHHEYYCTEADALEVVQDLPFYYDEPFADSSAIPTILVSRMARKSVTVALSADAGDEIFGGYDRYEWILKYYKRINAIPALARQGGAALLRAVDLTRWPRWQDDFVFQKKYEKLQTLLRKPDAQNIFLGASVYFNDRELSDLFKIPPQAGYSAHYCEAMQSAYFDPLSYAMAKDYETYLVDDILQKVDRATMSISLEGREPFLDQHIIEWAAGLPADYKIYNGQRKYILRRIVHQYIPEQIMDRPKMGFAVPIRSWLHQALKPLVDHYFSASFLKQQGIFNEKYLQRISGSYYEKGRENDYKIWFILMFQMWYDKWMRA